jgi:hypothetical protein
MDFADQPSQDALRQRLDDLQLRVDQLELLVLPDTEEPVVSSAVPAQKWTDAKPVIVDGRPAVRDNADPITGELQQQTTETLEFEETKPTTASAGISDAEPVVPAPSVAPAPSPSHAHGASAQAPRSSTTIDLAYVEERLAGRALALVGGAALILGAVFFLSLAFSRGWIGPSLQVTLGLIGGSVALLAGGILAVRGDRIVGLVLTPVGLAVITLSLFAATTLYGLVEPVVGLIAILVAAAATTGIAIVARSQVVAGFGLIAVLAAPPLLGASPDMLTLAFMVTVLSGVAVISLWQTWPWLPPIAFLISVPQVYQWIASGPEDVAGAAGLLAYWALLAVAAGGEAFRRRQPQLTVTSAPLFMVLGASVIGLAFELLTQSEQRVAFLLTLAALHAVVAARFLLRRGEVDPFGLLAAAYGIAIASMAVPLLFGASLTAVVWSAEAAVLAVVAGRRAHGPSLMAGIVLLSIAAIRIGATALEAEMTWAYQFEATVGPFDAIVISLAFFLVAAVAAVLAIPDRAVRLVLVAIAALATLPVIYYELDGVAAVAAWSGVMLLTLAAPRWLGLLHERLIVWKLGPALEWLRPQRSLTDDAALLTGSVAVLAGALALAATAVTTAWQDVRPDVPFTDRAGLSALIVAGSWLAVGTLVAGAVAGRFALIGAAAVLGMAVVFQVPLVWVVVVWAVLATAGFALARTLPHGRFAFTGAGAVALAAAGSLAVLLATPDRLIVQLGGLAPHPPFLSEATLALSAVALGLAAAGRLHPRTQWTDWALAGAGIVALYLLSVGVVDVFAGDAYGPPRASRSRVDTLAKEAQVALSVIWTVVGVVVTGVGLILKRSALRVAGLAVLALATAKVFTFDLASLDIAYRVITLIVLGVLLIISAWVWNRLKPASPSGDDGTAEPQVHDAHARSSDGSRGANRPAS